MTEKEKNMKWNRTKRNETTNAYYIHVMCLQERHDINTLAVCIFNTASILVMFITSLFCFFVVFFSSCGSIKSQIRVNFCTFGALCLWMCVSEKKYSTQKTIWIRIISTKQTVMDIQLIEEKKDQRSNLIGRSFETMNRCYINYKHSIHNVIRSTLPLYEHVVWHIKCMFVSFVCA